jgi:hypothetical protein
MFYCRRQLGLRHSLYCHGVAVAIEDLHRAPPHVWRQARVAHRHLDLRVPQQLLHPLERHAAQSPDAMPTCAPEGAHLPRVEQAGRSETGPARLVADPGRGLAGLPAGPGSREQGDGTGLSCPRSFLDHESRVVGSRARTNADARFCCRPVAMKQWTGAAQDGTTTETAGPNFLCRCSRMRGKFSSRKGFRAPGLRLFDSRRLRQISPLKNGYLSDASGGCAASEWMVRSSLAAWCRTCAVGSSGIRCGPAFRVLDRVPGTRARPRGCCRTPRSPIFPA